MTAATVWDSNLFRTATAPTRSMKVTLAPEVVIASDWSRHAAKLELGAEAGVFTHSSDDNYLDTRARLAGELDITRKARLSLGVTAERGHDPRGADDVPAGAAEPAIFTRLQVTLGGEVAIGRIRLAPFAAWRHVDFDDVALTGGGRSDQDTRDRREVEAGFEAGLRTGRAWELLIRAGVFDVEYRLPATVAGPARDARGMTALGGVRIRITELLRARIAAGITRRDYADPSFADLTTLAAEAGVDWRPTRRLTFLLDLARKVDETAVAGAAGRVTTAAGLSVEYELLRTLSLAAGGRFTHGRYGGIARTDRTFEARLGAAWSPMRGLGIRPEYAFATRTSDAAGEDFTGHSLSLTATYRFGAIE